MSIVVSYYSKATHCSDVPSDDGINVDQRATVYNHKIESIRHAQNKYGTYCQLQI